MSRAVSTAYYDKMVNTPVSKLVITLGIPTTISMLVTNIYNMADTFFVSTLGNSASGAVGVVFGLMAIIQAIGFMFGHGAGSNIARRLGEGDVESADKYASTSFFASLMAGGAVSVLGFLFLNPLMRLLGSTGTILPYARDYGMYILVAAPIMMASFVLNNILRYEGKAYLSMCGLVSGAIINIVLDPILIFGLKMGIAGAGLSTAISQCVSFSILLAIFLMGKTECRIRVRYFSYVKSDVILSIMKTGFPSLLRQGLNSISTMILNHFAGIYGKDAAIAAMSIVNRIVFFVFAVGLGIGQGFQPVASFNYGARKYTRVKKAFGFTVIVGEVLLGVFAVVAFFLSGNLVSVFRDDADVIKIGTLALRFQLVSLFFQPLVICTNMLFQSVGANKKASFTALLRSGLYFIPAIVILSSFTGLLGVQIAQPVADILSFITVVPLAVAFIRNLPADGEEDIGDINMQNFWGKLKNGTKKFIESLKNKIDFKNNKVRHIVGLVILLLQVVATITLIVYLNILNILPNGLYTIIMIVLVVALLLNLGLNITKRIHILGKIIGVLATIVMCFGCYYLHHAVNMLQTITAEHYDVDNYLVVTLKDNDSISEISDVAGKEVGLAENGGSDDVMKNVKEELENRVGGKVKYKTYEDMSYLIAALFDGEVEVIVYMEAYDEFIMEILDYFAGSVKVIDTIEVKTLITEDMTQQGTDESSTDDNSADEDPSEEQSTEADDLNQNVNTYDPSRDPNAPGGGGYIGGDTTKDNSKKGPITDRAFNVYISGIDRYGKVSGKSRSDVNILMTVNPMTKEIILTNTPRDYYVPIPGKTTGTWRDKLTHAGLYGVWYSVSTLENIYDVEIDYYVRVNFTSFIDIIDAIGGVEVYSSYNFSAGGYSFKKGMNSIPTGRMALAFARERKAFAAGDNQRGKNHMAIIEGVIDKAISPALLTNFVEIVNTISKSLQTNMTMDEITALAKMQLGDGSSWTIKQQAATGTSARRTCYSWRSSELSVMLPNQSSIDSCRAAIKALMGKKVEKETTTTVDPNIEDTSETTSPEETTTVQEETTSVPEETTNNEESSDTSSSAGEISSEAPSESGAADDSSITPEEPTA